MNKIIFGLLLLLPAKAFCQFPETDIWLMHIADNGGKAQFTNAKNITNRKGYDNQPAFSPDGKRIYFTSATDTAQTDIYYCTLATGQITQYTFSATSEFSPMVTPTGSGISVLMVEADGAQRLWQYPFSGAKPSRIFPAADSVAYYTWLGANAALADVLVRDTATTEKLYLLKTDGTVKKLADNIGRGMQGFGKGALFIQREDTVNYVYLTDFTEDKKMVRAPGGSQDLAIWKNYILMADGATMYAAKMHVANGAITAIDNFVAVQNLSPFGLNKISRIAVSPDETLIAVVMSMQ